MHHLYFWSSYFAKAIEVKWNQKERFKDSIIMLGIFHMIMMYMGIMSKRFKDAGLRDILVQSSILTEVSVDLPLSGKMYNRSIRAHKLMYGSTMQIISESLMGCGQADT